MALRPRYRVTVRTRARVERERIDELDAALERLESRVTELSASARGGAVDVKLRRFEPVQQVVARLELAGPARLRAGVDVRGDGSAEAYTGRIRRQLVEQRADEPPISALRRALAARRP